MGMRRTRGILAPVLAFFLAFPGGAAAQLVRVTLNAPSVAPAPFASVPLALSGPALSLAGLSPLALTLSVLPTPSIQAKPVEAVPVALKSQTSAPPAFVQAVQPAASAPERPGEAVKAEADAVFDGSTAKEAAAPAVSVPDLDRRVARLARLAEKNAGLELRDGGLLNQRLEELPLSERTPAGLARTLLSESDVLLIGENHLSLATHEIIRQILLAPPPGLKLISFEGPRRKSGDEKLIGDSMGADIGVSGAVRMERYREIALAAQAAKLPVLNIDASLRNIVLRLARRLKVTAQEAGALFVRAVERDLELSDLAHAAFDEVLLDYRNRLMARILARHLRAGGKAILLLGDAHIEHGHPTLELIPGRTTLASELAAHGLRPFSLSVIGGPMASGNGDDVVRKPLYDVFDAAMDQPGSLKPTSERTAILYLGPIETVR